MKQIFLIFAITLIANLNGQNVSSFTGAFSYDVPLMIIPSNRGNPINLTASYQAGIQMSQSASEIGLGWNLNSENAIYRTVSGLPDDTKTFNSKDLPTGDPITNGHGALYPDPAGTTDYDVTEVRRGLDTMKFSYPDFDNYHVSGSLLSGQMKLSYYKYYSYEFNGSKYIPNQTGSYNSLVYRKPQFHFVGDFADTLVSRHYPSSPINSGTSFKTPLDVITGNGYTSSSESFIGKHLSNTTIVNDNFDISSGRLATSNLVEYFTNAEIDAGTGNGFSVLDNSNIFIDYKSNHYRSSASFPEDGIGYFRITGSNGLTYHYSLPVYEKVNTTYKIPLNNDYSLVSGLSTGDLPDYMGAEYVQHPSNVNVFVKSKTYNKTAVKWLLVAVTGADFVDVNNNHLADDGDEGYWLSYDYQQWSGNFTQRSPHYGYDFQYLPDLLTQKFPVYFPMAKGSLGEPYKVSGLFGSVQVNKSEVYHLSRIRTPSHTAIFVRDIRNDERSSDSSVTIDANFKPAPDLLLKRIVLFKNEQIDSLLSIYPKINFNTSNYSNFSFSAVNNTAIFFTSPWFSQNYNAIYPSILKNVAFNHDYSLCRNYHNNINVNYSGSSVLTPPGTVESNLSVSSYNTSGKLTLNGIYISDYKDGKVIPSTQFDYNASNSSGFSNPDYNPRKTDYWGYYKHDATANGYSRYTSVYSRNYTKAWSLLKVTDPLGGLTEMEYESNSYNKVIDNEVSGGVRGAAFIYRIKMANTIAASFDISMEEGNGSSNLLTEFPDLVPGTISGLKARVCIPYYEATCYNSAACVLYNLTNTHSKGFVFGDCTFALQTTPAGGTYSITGNVTLPSSNIRHVYTFNDNILFTGNSNVTGSTVNYYSVSNTSSDKAYAGNGFLMCETPVGYDAYGAGVRLKRLKVRNSINEVYTTEYTYEDGVATGEMDRFNYQVLKAGYVGSPVRYDFLEPKNFTIFDMAPYVGYSKVTIKNLGRISTANGKIEETFLTDPTYNSSAFSHNYAIHTEATNDNSSQLQMINECIVKFPSAFGLPLESKVYDISNNMISRSTREYETTQQGALTENFHFQYLSHRGVFNLQTVNILRSVPVVLKRVTDYGMGGSSVTETIARDELTGETVSVKNVGQNNSSSLSFKKMAFRHYQPSEGLVFTQPAFRKVLPLGSNMFSYATVDSALTSTQGNGYSASFANASYKLYSKIIRQRQYNTTTGKFTTSQVTLPSYINNRGFIFDAGESALNEYGLLNKSVLYSNPLNLSSINSYLFWEPSSAYNWKLVYEYTLLDNYKNMVEARDANNRFNAKRFAYKGYHESAKVSNCNYASFTFADFETLPPNSGNATIDGDILVNNHTFIHASSMVPHTGARCIQITSTPVSFTTASESSPSGNLEIGLQSGRIYRASVWAHNTNLSKARLEVTINGMVNVSSPYALSNVVTASSANNLVTTIGSWNLLQVDFVIPDKFVTGTGTPLKIELKSSDNSTVYFDDFILHPVESSFSASVYNPRNGRVVSGIDANGLATGYVYDASGRVLEVWKEVPGVGYKQITKHTYNYARGANN